MGQVLHGSATTTEAVRRAIQHSQESLRALARRYGVNPKTIAKWKARSSVSDLPTRPREPRSTVLTVEEEAVVIAFRRHTLLPLNNTPAAASRRGHNSPGQAKNPPRERASGGCHHYREWRYPWPQPC
jgi:transposase-like protein